jgi:hypothetical protein
LGPGLALATVALVAVVAAPRIGTGTKGATGGLDPNLEPYIGTKGGASVQVFAKRGTDQLIVGAGTTLKPQDRIRFVVEPGGARYVLIASRDGAGQISVYYPYGGDKSGPVTSARQELPDSIELDSVLGREQIFAVFSQEPLLASEVRRAIESGSGSALKIDGAGDVVRLEFVKEPK